MRNTENIVNIKIIIPQKTFLTWFWKNERLDTDSWWSKILCPKVRFNRSFDLTIFDLIRNTLIF